jgi:hypothetical protein
VNPDPTTVTISYKTKWAAGIPVPTLDAAAPDNPLKITYTPGAKAHEAIIVTITVQSDKGQSGDYTVGTLATPIVRTAGANDFSVDLSDLATALLTDLINATGKVGPVTVTQIKATPVRVGLPNTKDGDPIKVSGTLSLALKQVLGTLPAAGQGKAGK